MHVRNIAHTLKFLSLGHGIEPPNTDLPAAKIYDYILQNQELAKQQPYFFVDLCYVTSNQPVVLEVVDLAATAQLRGWYVILSYSSGGGWMIEQSSSLTSQIRVNLGKLDERSYQLRTTVFSNEEAKKYIDEFQVDVEKLKEQGIEVANNPFLLSCFHDTKSAADTDDTDVERSRTGEMRYMDRIHHLTERFLRTFSDPVHQFSSFNNCLTYLEVARHGATLTNHLLQKYKNSYLALEYLTELEKNADGAYTIKLQFPSMYDVIVNKLKESFKERKIAVLEQPVVKGYIFETSFLQYKDLRSLTISVVGLNVNSLTLTFPNLTPAVIQESEPIHSELIPNQIYHLRSKHPAIDGVCVTVTDDSLNVRYLLLLQVSLRDYRTHISKGIDIRKKVPASDEGRFCEGDRKTIAEYYKALAKIEDDSRVIYAYVSPSQLGDPTKEDFSQELKSHDTRTQTLTTPEYLYGFCCCESSFFDLIMKQM